MLVLEPEINGAMGIGPLRTGKPLRPPVANTRPGIADKAKKAAENSFMMSVGEKQNSMLLMRRKRPSKAHEEEAADGEQDETLSRGTPSATLYTLTEFVAATQSDRTPNPDIQYQLHLAGAAPGTFSFFSALHSLSTSSPLPLPETCRYFPRRTTPNCQFFARAEMRFN